MNAFELAGLASLRHAHSRGRVLIVASPERVVATTEVATIDDAIGMLAMAMTAMLEERAKAANTVEGWLPEAMRAIPDGDGSLIS